MVVQYFFIWLSYQLPILGSRGCPLCPQQISRRKVYMTIFLNYPGTLGSLASSWPSKYKHNIGLCVTHPDRARTQPPPHKSNTCSQHSLIHFSCRSESSNK